MQIHQATKNCTFYDKYKNVCNFRLSCYRLPSNCVSHEKCRPVKRLYIKPNIFVQFKFF